MHTVAQVMAALKNKGNPSRQPLSWIPGPGRLQTSRSSSLWRIPYETLCSDVPGCAARLCPQAHAAHLFAQSELNGAWEIVAVSGTNAEGDWTLDNVQPSLYLFQDGYYSIMYVKGSQARPKAAANARRADMPEATMRGMFNTDCAMCGTHVLTP